MSYGGQVALLQMLLPAAFEFVQLAAVAFGGAAVGVGGADAAGLVERFLLFAFGGGGAVFGVEGACFGGGAALVVEREHGDFVGQGVEREVDGVARLDVFAVL